jgi:anti-anti-sigma factor
MANDRPRVDRAPPTTADRLDRVLDRRLAFRQAQGVLSEIAGCTPARAGEVLLQIGAQLGFDSADGVAEFFLASAATDPTGPDTLVFARRATADGFATLIAGGRGLVVRGELDIATAPLLAAAFIDHEVAAAPGHTMLLDLHDLRFIDVTGVRALAEIHTRAGRMGVHLRVSPPLHPFTGWTLQFAVQLGWLPPLFSDGSVRLS